MYTTSLGHDDNMTQQDLKKYLDGLARKGQQLSPQLIKVRLIWLDYRLIRPTP